MQAVVTEQRPLSRLFAARAQTCPLQLFARCTLTYAGNKALAESHGRVLDSLSVIAQFWCESCLIFCLHLEPSGNTRGSLSCTILVTLICSLLLLDTGTYRGLGCVARTRFGSLRSSIKIDQLEMCLASCRLAVSSAEHEDEVSTRVTASLR